MFDASQGIVRRGKSLGSGSSIASGQISARSTREQQEERLTTHDSESMASLNEGLHVEHVVLGPA